MGICGRVHLWSSCPYLLFRKGQLVLSDSLYVKRPYVKCLSEIDKDGASGYDEHEAKMLFKGREPKLFFIVLKNVQKWIQFGAKIGGNQKWSMPAIF